ncbi:hypothetical protein KR009_011238 [Drosophila setifemur]|nr:hypothetical protein KR009_011238 [Drosophila setifemur]
MKKPVGLLLLVLVGVWGANDPDPDLDTIERALDSLSNVVGKYKSEFDSKVRLQELQEVIDTIDKSMLDYQGTAKNNLNPLRSLYSASRFTYQKCVDPVFEWCVAANSTLSIFIPNINNPILPPHDKAFLWNVTAKALGDGLARAYGSLELLNELKSKATELQSVLDEMLSSFRADFAPNGTYAKREEELHVAIKESRNRAITKERRGPSVTDVIGRFFRAILALLKKPKGGAAHFMEVFNRKGLSEVIDERRLATYQEELDTIRTFFLVLDDQIKNASKIAGQVNVDLAKDKANLEDLALAPNNPAHKKIEDMLQGHTELQGGLIPSLQKLGSICHAYTVVRTTPRIPPHPENPLPSEDKPINAHQ